MSRLIARTSRRAFSRLRAGVVLLTGLAAAIALSAAPLPRDLGDGLAYFRAHDIPADMPAEATLRDHPAILDLRFAHGDAAGGRVLGSWLRFRSPHAPLLLILLNKETARVLVQAIDDVGDVPGVLLVGPGDQDLDLDVSVRTTPAEDRRTYEALEHGSTVSGLTTDNPGKVRNDEASLNRDRNGAPDEEVDAQTDGDEATAKPAKTPIDAVLQRAIQLCRGLHALPPH